MIMMLPPLLWFPASRRKEEREDALEKDKEQIKERQAQVEEKVTAAEALVDAIRANRRNN